MLSPNKNQDEGCSRVFYSVCLSEGLTTEYLIKHKIG